MPSIIHLILLLFLTFLTTTHCTSNTFTQSISDPSPYGCQISPSPNFLSPQVASIFISSIHGNDYLPQTLNSSSLIRNTCAFVKTPCQSLAHALSQLSNMTCVSNPCTGFVVFLLDDVLDDEEKSCNLQISSQTNQISIKFMGFSVKSNWKCVSNSVFRARDDLIYQGIFFSNVIFSGNLNLRVCTLSFESSNIVNSRFYNKYYFMMMFYNSQVLDSSIDETSQDETYWNILRYSTLYCYSSSVNNSTITSYMKVFFSGCNVTTTKLYLVATTTNFLDSYVVPFVHNVECLFERSQITYSWFTRSCIAIEKQPQFTFLNSTLTSTQLVSSKFGRIVLDNNIMTENTQIILRNNVPCEKAIDITRNLFERLPDISRILIQDMFATFTFSGNIVRNFIVAFAFMQMNSLTNVKFQHNRVIGMTMTENDFTHSGLFTFEKVDNVASLNNTFIGNKGYYGPYYFTDCGNVIITGDRFVDNKAIIGGAMFDSNVGFGRYLKISNSVFSNNYASYGGVIGTSLVNSIFFFKDNLFENNRAKWGGAILADLPPLFKTELLQTNQFVNNTIDFQSESNNIGGNPALTYLSPNGTISIYPGELINIESRVTDLFNEVVPYNSDFKIDVTASQPNIMVYSSLNADPLNRKSFNVYWKYGLIGAESNFNQFNITISIRILDKSTYGRVLVNIKECPSGYSFMNGYLLGSTNSNLFECSQIPLIMSMSIVGSSLLFGFISILTLWLCIKIYTSIKPYRTAKQQTMMVLSMQQPQNEFAKKVKSSDVELETKLSRLLMNADNYTVLKSNEMVEVVSFTSNWEKYVLKIDKSQRREVRLNEEYSAVPMDIAETDEAKQLIANAEYYFVIPGENNGKTRFLGIDINNRPIFHPCLIFRGADFDLSHYLSVFGHFSKRFEEKIDILQQIAKAMNWLHSNRIYHRDLKPGNIFVWWDVGKKPTLKIGDFGASSSDNILEGTYPYIAPELINESDMDELPFSQDRMEWFAPADVYSFSVIMWDVLFEDNTRFIRYYRMKKYSNDDYSINMPTLEVLQEYCEKENRFELNSKIELTKLLENYLEIFKRCNDENQKKRPTFEFIEKALNGNVENWDSYPTYSRREPIDRAQYYRHENYSTSKFIKIETDDESIDTEYTRY